MKHRFLLILILLVATLGVLFARNIWNRQSEAEEAEAEAFCESFIPQIEAIKRRTGKFPEKLDPSLLKSKILPRLINSNEFYAGHEDYYDFHFQNPGRLDNLFVFEYFHHVWLNGDSDSR